MTSQSLLIDDPLTNMTLRPTAATSAGGDLIVCMGILLEFLYIVIKKKHFFHLFSHYPTLSNLPHLCLLASFRDLIYLFIYLSLCHLYFQDVACAEDIK